MKKLTARQQQVLDFIETYRHENGGMPSVRDVADHFGFRSPNAAADHLRALERKGYLENNPHQARGLRIVSPLGELRRPVVDIPIYGEIPAGFSDAREQAPVGCVTVDVDTLGVTPGNQAFALQVRGDSMIDRHILEGDVVICEPGRSPKPGNVVAALIDNESTLKTFMLQRNKPYLKAENPNYPNLVPATDLVIQGIVVAIIRRFK